MPSLITWWSHDVHTIAPQAHEDVITRSGAELLARWSEPARRYHTTRHLMEMFSALEDLEEAREIDDRQGSVARLAAWFHDAIYDPGANPGSNEADSAALARHCLQNLGLGDDDLDAIDRLIRLTANHDPLETDPHDSDPQDTDPHDTDPLDAAFHDADLWILSAPKERFDEYCDQVREEYARVPDAAYRQGRAAILEPLRHRDTIYRSSFALLAWETSARVNLGRELARLRE
jgi:predicted metal-dependent HD superfamily phosphohydrolase